MSVEVANRYAAPIYPLVPLDELLIEPIAYGTSARLSEEAVGLPVLRMNNLTMHGWDTADVKYLDTAELDVHSLQISTGDVLVNRTNGSINLVGKAAVFDLAGDWLFASYLLRVRVAESKILPDFLVYFLNSPAGRMQIERLARPILMVNISPPELRRIKIPLPSIKVQRKLLEPVKAALAAKAERDRDAAAELKAIGVALNDAVGVALPNADAANNTFASTPSQSRRVNRLGPQFFHPERAAAMAAVLAAKNARPLTLRHVADFVKINGTPSASEQFLGLASVESDTGELLPDSDEPGEGRKFEAGDVLFSRLRPYLNKVHRAASGGYCSPEFHVLRVRENDFDPTFLAITLRSPMVLAQTRHLTTGNTHPRVVEADAGGILLPVPTFAVQKALGRQLEDRRSKAQTIRGEANQTWAQAQIAFNEALLG